MTAKNYLGQAKFLDQRIETKVQQINSLNELATLCAVAISGMPGSPNRGGSKVEDCTVKIVDLQEEVKRDVSHLVDLKRDIMATIRKVDDPELQVILEKRYLCFIPWEKIAVEMGYSVQHVFRLHDKAAKAVAKVLAA